MVRRMTNSSPLIWVLTDDRPGNAGQALGVAEALAKPFIQKDIRYSSLGKLPNIVRGSTLIGVTDESVAGLTAPWPDLVIAAGRRTAPVARWIKKVSGQPVHLVQIMNPGSVGAEDFSLIAIPRHDCTRPDGDLPNVMRITGAPHRFSQSKFEADAAMWAPRLAALSRPYVVLFVGGATRQQPFSAMFAKEVCARVNAMAKSLGGSVLLATSRRTGFEAEATLKATIDAPSHLYLWGQEKESLAENPYGGFLALADAIVVTGDSVSMCSEACANPGSVYIYAPEEMVSDKHARLHRELYERGVAKPFTAAPPLFGHEPFTHAPLNVAADLAARIAELMAKHLG